MAVNNIYKYDVSLTILLNDSTEIIEISNSNIIFLYNEFDYIKYNMPITFLTISLDKNVIDKMIQYNHNSLINLTISKYVENADMKIPIHYIRDQFIYFIAEDYNPNKLEDYMENDGEQVLAKLSIGLLKLDFVNLNKKQYSGIIKNSNLTSLIYYCCGHLPSILIEPLTYNPSIEQLILPPIDSVSNMLKYLNTNYHVFYDSPYRFFMDFQNSFLVSSNGTMVKRKGDKINSVTINVLNMADRVTVDEGMIIDSEQGLYIVNISSNMVEANTNTSMEKYFNSLDITSSGGLEGSETLNLDNSSYMKPKREIMRVGNDNNKLILNKKHELENNRIIIEVHKTNLDTAVFTINKEYTIKATSSYPDRDGKYILIKKKEVYLRENENFIMDTILTFKKLQA